MTLLEQKKEEILFPLIIYRRSNNMNFHAFEKCSYKYTLSMISITRKLEEGKKSSLDDD
jgi:hypothetical protein